MTTRSLTTPQLLVGPDGCTLDAEGHVWVADGFHGSAGTTVDVPHASRP